MKKILAITFLIFLALGQAFAIGFGYHVLKIDTTPEFAEGAIPTNVKYQFNFPMVDFVPGAKTELAFSLNNGFLYRTMEQSPIDGSLYSKDATWKVGDRVYSVLYNEFSLFFKQGVMHTSLDTDFITIGLAINGRFEDAYERFSFMDGVDETEGVFWSSPGVRRFDPDGTWIGNPELEGSDRSSFHTSISTELVLNLLEDKRSVRNGVKASLSFRCNPKDMFLNDGTGDYTLTKAKIDVAFTPFKIMQKKSLTFVSLVLDDHFSIRMINGEKVPRYAQEDELWKVHMPNSEFVIQNRASISLYGSQMHYKDLYPVVTGFFDIGYSFGKLLNTSLDESIDEIALAAGVRVEFIIFNIAKVFYECGWVLDPVYNEEKETRQTFGVRLGI